MAEVEHIEGAEDVARESRYRFGPLPEPVKNLLYIVRIKVLAARAKISSIAMQGRQIVIKPQSGGSPLKVRGGPASTQRHECLLGGVMSKHLDPAVKIGATQIKLETRLLGDRWQVVLEEILSSNSA